MIDAVALFAAAEALDPAQSAVGTAQLIPALLVIVLATLAMFRMLFWTKWGNDPTNVMEQRRRRRFLAPQQHA